MLRTRRRLLSRPSPGRSPAHRKCRGFSFCGMLGCLQRQERERDREKQTESGEPECRNTWIGEPLNAAIYLCPMKGTRPRRIPNQRGYQFLVKRSPSYNMLDGVAQYARDGGAAPASNPQQSKAKREGVCLQWKEGKGRCEGRE